MTNRLSFIALLLWFTCPVAWAQLPVGPEFQVNSYTTGYQVFPSVASDATGDFVVVWEGQDGSSSGVVGRRFNAAGLAQGGEFQVNSHTTSWQFFPAVASDASGNFVVTWQSMDQDGSGWGVFGQRFDATGVPQGGEFRVNSRTTSDQSYPAVASDPSGHFVVVWTSFGQDGSSGGVFGQRFDPAGLPQGGEFQVNSHTTSLQTYPMVASDANGNFVVVWESYGQSGSVDDVFGQRFDAAGLPQGAEFQVNSYTTGYQGYPAVAADASGSFVVVWTGDQQNVSGWSVFGQRFDGSGVPQGGEFRVSSDRSAGQGAPAVASAANGHFAVVWQSYLLDGSGWGVFGQRFDGSAVPQGRGFRVNSYTTGDQGGPTLASAANGNFVVAWHSNGQDGSSYGIFGRRYGDLIFRDGFQ